jgi:hypothetical protein
MGLAERCDALVIVASEERGEVTLMHDSTFETVATASALLTLLRTLMPPPVPSSRWPVFNGRELGLQAVAAAIAFAIWASALYTGSAVRVRTVPIEFTNVAPGLRITGQSAVAVDVRLRGSSWLLDSPGTDQVVVRVSLAGLEEGAHSVEISPGLLRLPLGVFGEDVSPERVQLRLAGSPRGGRQDAGRESK